MEDDEQLQRRDSLADKLAGQFILWPDGTRHYLKPFRRIIRELQDGKAPIGAILGPLVEPYKTITSMYFPKCDIRLDTHHPDDCGGICNGKPHPFTGSICRFCKDKTYRSSSTRETSTWTMYRHVTERCKGLNAAEREMTGSAFKNIDGVGMDKARRQILGQQKRQQASPYTPEQLARRNALQNHRRRKARMVDGGRTSTNGESSHSDTDSTVSVDSPNSDAVHTANDVSTSQEVQRLVDELKRGHPPHAVLGPLRPPHTNYTSMYFPHLAPKLDVHDKNECQSLCDGSRHPLPVDICSFCLSIIFQQAPSTTHKRKASVMRMCEHLRDKCTGVGHSARRILLEAFESLDKEIIEKARRKRMANKAYKAKNPLTEQQLVAHRIRVRRSYRSRAATLRGHAYVSSDEDCIDEAGRKLRRARPQIGQGSHSASVDSSDAHRPPQKKAAKARAPGARVSVDFGDGCIAQHQQTKEEECSSYSKPTAGQRLNTPGVYSIEASESSDSSLPDLPRRLPKARKGARRPSPQEAPSNVRETPKDPIDSSDDERPLKRSRETRTEMRSSPGLSAASSASVPARSRPQQRLEVVVPSRSHGRREPLAQSDSAATSKAGSRGSSISAEQADRQISIARSSTTATGDAEAIGARKPPDTKPTVIDLTSDSAESSEEGNAAVVAPVVMNAAKARKERGGSKSDVEMAVDVPEEQGNDGSEEEEPFFPFYDPTDVSETESLMDYKLERELAIQQDPYAASILHLKLQPLPKELQPFKPLLMEAGIRNKTDLLANVRPHRIKRFVNFLIERFPNHLDTPAKRFSLEERLEDALA